MATDKLFFNLVTHFPQTVLRLLKIETTSKFHAQSITLKETELRLDGVLVSDDPAAPRVIVEFQGYWEKGFLRRFLADTALYCHKQEYEGDLLPIAIFTKASFARGLLPATFRFEGGETLSFQPRVIVLEALGEEEILATEVVELIPLLPLCRVTEERVKAEALSWREKIEASALPEPEKKMLVSLLGGFIVHRLGDLSLEAFKQILGGFPMEETRVGQELIEMGRIKGIQQGTLETRREVAQRILEKRFKAIPRSVLAKLAALDTPEIAEQALNLALEAESLEAFDAMLEKILEG